MSTMDPECVGPWAMPGHPACVPSTFDGVTTAVKRNMQEVSQSGKFYVTPMTCREMRHITNGVNIIRLDHDLLNDNTWRRRCNPRSAPNTTEVHKLGTRINMHNAAERLFDIKYRMDIDKINNYMDNETREVDHMTMQDLKAIERDIGPYVHESTGRIKEYCDYRGVTDRFTGYRHNLNRGNRAPINLAFSWYDSSEFQPNTNNELKSTRRPYTCDIGSLPVREKPPKPVKNPGYRPPTIQEACGLNLVFPGHSEYMDRYAPPPEKKTPDFQINPSPDFTLLGRPMAKPLYVRSISEVQDRYRYPDGKEIMLFPWLRK